MAPRHTLGHMEVSRRASVGRVHASWKVCSNGFFPGLREVNSSPDAEVCLGKFSGRRDPTVALGAKRLVYARAGGEACPGSVKRMNTLKRLPLGGVYGVGCSSAAGEAGSNRAAPEVGGCCRSAACERATCLPTTVDETGRQCDSRNATECGCYGADHDQMFALGTRWMEVQAALNKKAMLTWLRTISPMDIYQYDEI